MKIELAKTAGFCHGVKAAVSTVYNIINEGNSGRIFTFGPIIHNDTVIAELKEKGVFPIDEKEAFKIEPSTIIIRAHGIADPLKKRLIDYGHRVVDATCPFVSRIHDMVNEYSKKGYHVLVVGDGTHPEIIGIVGNLPSDGFSIIGTPQEAEKFNLNKTFKLYIVAQTTFNEKLFQECVEIIEKKGYDVVCSNTICAATKNRQEEAVQIAARVGAMIVIGGKNSSNSNKLFLICKEKCNNTFFVQTKEDLDISSIHSEQSLGITAGASTPENIIREVLMKCQR